MNGVNIPQVKVEYGDGHSSAAEPQLKPESDSVGASPSALSEDDIYEDTGDLDFSQCQDVRLMRIPKWLWENWAIIDDDEEIQIGTVRMENLGKDKNGHDNQKMTLLLSPIKHNKAVPKEYNMHITNSKSSNIYLFSEKDLPGYKSRGRQRALNGAGSQDMKSSAFSANSLKSDREDKPTQLRPDRTKRWQPYVRKAIPKQTALSGVVRSEINCLPVENEEYAQIMARRAQEAQAPKRETKFLSGIGANPGNLLAPGTLGASGNFGGFIKTGAPQRTKPQEHKAARIPQNELLDLIYDCFKRYNYWSLKALKAELNQPEAYLRSTLEMVAELVKSGRFAMTWTLKPENKIDQYAGGQAMEEQAPDAGYGMEGVSEAGEGIDDGGGLITGDDDDDDSVKMEDVMLL